ncbi:MAG: CBS domain-containing protein [Bacilli bacterium]|jgi:CBS domain-containing protein|nr:CBS domain-containing protein [Staphylococcus sp.]
MNILFFLKPKKEVVYVNSNATIRQALEKMERYRYTTVPILNDDGEYVGTLSEGDILWEIKNRNCFDLKTAELTKIGSIRRHRDNLPININADMNDLIIKATAENFVPVLDDRNKFIGIVTRTDIIKYFFEKNKSI